ncbi:MAG: DUF732 domain-containing protein [Mycobacterium sp.]
MRRAERRPDGLAKWSATKVLVASSAALLTGCSVADDVMATVGMPTSESAPAHGQAGAEPPGPPQPNGNSDAIPVTGQQRGYLDALNTAGVQPSSELLALRIGSYVCQARAAKQSDQGVWDIVAPLVRNDVRTAARMSASAPSTDEVNSKTADYIRIATNKLC